MSQITSLVKDWNAWANVSVLVRICGAGRKTEDGGRGEKKRGRATAPLGESQGVRKHRSKRALQGALVGGGCAPRW